MADLNRGAVAAVIDVVRRKRQEKAEEEKEFRAFQRRLVEAGIKAEIERGNIGLRHDNAVALQGVRDQAAMQRQQATVAAQRQSANEGRLLQAQIGQANRAQSGQNATIAALMRRPDIVPILEQMGLGGMFEQREQQPFDPGQLKEGQSYSQKVPGGTLTSRGPAAARPLSPLDQIRQEILNRQNELAQAQQIAGPSAQRIRSAPVIGHPDRDLAGARQRALDIADDPVQKIRALLNQAVQSGQLIGLKQAQEQDSLAGLLSSPVLSAAQSASAEEFPDPTQYEEGTVIESENGQRYQLVQGEWVPL